MSKERVYALLREQTGAFVSGQELSAQLGVSRAAIWKVVDSLRRDGYTIEARTGMGYRLTAAPDTLVEREIRRQLPPEALCPVLHCLEEIDSTNSYLKREALLGAVHGTTAVANHQTAGRGRRSRGFLSPAGRGVYLSTLLRPQLPPKALLGATGMAAVAVCNAVERTAGVRPGIKWTNDLVLAGKKLCGILTELTVEGETGMAESLIIGAGVNVSHSREDFGPGLAEIATSLSLEGHQTSRTALAAAMIEEFSKLADSLGGCLDRWVDLYRRDCVTLGKPVRLLWDSRQTEALALDVDSQFGLLVRFPDGTEQVVRTGEVSVRGMYGYTD
ncbi:MAG: biotin--[acetyl-CoA-carboxylase] ligase [Oscillospiraceae bacterium]|nr:biotin--[acetyl-CoA-carboxylase] ligase [Oscillospiraceae bacterium]